MVEFVNNLEEADHKYFSGGSVVGEDYNRMFLFHLRVFLSFGTDQK